MRLLLECTEPVSLSEAEVRSLAIWLQAWADRLTAFNRKAGSDWLDD